MHTKVSILIPKSFSGVTHFSFGIWLDVRRLPFISETIIRMLLGAFSNASVIELVAKRATGEAGIMGCTGIDLDGLLWLESVDNIFAAL